MNDINNFMQAVLGDAAAQALRKAAERSDGALDSVLGSRVIVGWLGLTSRWNYDGEVPGVPGSSLRFEKAQGNDTFTGSLCVDGQTEFEFEHADVLRMAAIMSVGMGVDQPVAKKLRDTDLVGLGKNIDVLLRAQVVKQMKKQEQPGQAAPPRGPGEPEAPTAPDPTPPRRNAAPAPSQQRQVKVTKSQSEQKCSVCEAPQFKKGEFRGCYCLRDLAKSARTQQTATGYVVTFGPEWSRSSIGVFLDIIGGKADGE